MIKIREVIENNYNCLIGIPKEIDKFIVLDIETTGLSDKDHIIEIGTYLATRQKLIKKCHLYIKPRVKINQNVSKFNNLPNIIYKINYKDNPRDSLSKFLSFINGYLIISHNALFDYKFINKELKYWGLPLIPLNRFRCTLRLFKQIIPKIDIAYEENSLTLENCCRYFGLVFRHKNKHRAFLDSLMTYNLFIHLLNKLKKNEIEETNQINITKINDINTNETKDIIDKILKDLADSSKKNNFLI